MKKKLLTLAVAATMVLSFAACGSNGNDSANTGSSSVAQSSTPSTESSVSTESSSQAQEDDSMTLADWLETEDAKQAESATNSALASSGMTVTLAADGNMFVYEYHLGAELELPSSDAFDEAFGPVIEANQAGLDSLFSSFETAYGIKLEGARFVFLDSDGNELYSGEVLNEN